MSNQPPLPVTPEAMTAGATDSPGPARRTITRQPTAGFALERRPGRAPPAYSWPTTAATTRWCGRRADLARVARELVAGARLVTRAGGADVLPQDALTTESLAERVLALVAAPHRLKEMGERATSLAVPDAAERIANVIETMA